MNHHKIEDEMEKIKRISIKEFKEKGFLQEVNRLFFHPLGMALEVDVTDKENYKLGGIWDYRDDPEGMNFADGMIDQKKIDTVEKLRKEKVESRKKGLGYIIQEK